MDTRDGRIVDFARIQQLAEAERKHYIPMRLQPSKRQLARDPARVGRNEPCPCGSGKKFKHCHFRPPAPPPPPPPEGTGEVKDPTAPVTSEPDPRKDTHA